MKTKRILKTVSIILASLVLLLILVVLFWLGPVVKAIAEGVGSKALGTPVAIEYLSINPRNGTVDLKAFAIGTHDGFAKTNTCSLAELHISVDMRSLLSDTIVVHEVRVESPHFTYEQNTATDNLSELIASLQEYAGIDPGEPDRKEPKDVAEEDDTDKPTKKVIIESLVVNDLQMHMANTDDPLLDTRLALEQFSMSFTNGVVQLKKLTFSNPGRLATPNLFELDSIDVQLDPDTIHSDKIVIEDVQIRQPHTFLETNPETDTIAEFMKIAGGLAAKAKTADTEESTDQPKPDPVKESEPAAPPPVELHNLYVDDIQLKLLDTTRTNAPTEPQALAAIGGISVRQVQGKLQIKGITVPNPDGFTATNLFHLAHIEVTLDPVSIFTPQIIIKEVRVDSPLVNLEQTETTGNVAELQKIFENFIPPIPEATEPVVAATESNTTADPVPLAEQPVILEALVVTNLAVNMILPVETNSTVMGKVGSLNPLNKVSLGDLNPMNLVSGNDTNTVKEAESEDGPVEVVAFDRLLIQPLEGLIRIDQLRIGNPKGFANPNLVSIDLLGVEIDPSTIQSNVMVINEILIDNPTVAYERKITTDNIKALQSSIENAVARRDENKDADSKEEELPDEPGETGSEEADKKVIIGHLLVKSGLVKAKLSALPTAPIPLPKIEMRDIGGETGGTSGAQAATEIGEKFYDEILGAVSGATGFATDALKGVGGLVRPGGEKALTGTDAITGEQLGGDSDESATIAESSEEPEPEIPPEKKQRVLRRHGRMF